MIPSECSPTLALKGAVQSLAGQYRATGGARIDADFAPTLALPGSAAPRRGRRRCHSDPRGLDQLAPQGSVVAVAAWTLHASYVGIAVKAGAEHPDIATEPALRAALLAARAVAYRGSRQCILFLRNDRAPGDCA